jgi:hypothetical protein
MKRICDVIVSFRRPPRQEDSEVTKQTRNLCDTGLTDPDIASPTSSVQDATVVHLQFSSDSDPMERPHVGTNTSISGLGPLASETIRRVVAGIQAVATDAKQMLQSSGSRKDENLLQPDHHNWRRAGHGPTLKTGKLGALSAAAGRLLLSAATAGSKGSYSYDLLAKG